MEDILLLFKQVPCIHYPVRFKKDKAQVLINSESEVNTMTLVYISKLGLKVRLTNIKVQKVDSSTFEIFGIVLASF